MKPFPAYPYIRDEAKRGGTGLSEAELRRMLRDGELPGFYSGKKQLYFRVDHAALLSILREKSVKVVKDKCTTAITEESNSESTTVS